MLPVQHRSLEWIPGAGSIGMVPVDRSESVWEPVVTGGPKSGRSQLPCAVRMQRVLHLSVCPAPFRWPVRFQARPALRNPGASHADPSETHMCTNVRLFA